VADFCRRVRLPYKLAESLISIGAMDGFGKSRRQLLWEVGELHGLADGLDLTLDVHQPTLAPLTRAETLRAEYLVLGLSTGDHPMNLYRAELAVRRILGSRALNAAPDKTDVRIAGQVVMHQAPPTAKGHHFVTLEDEDGMMNVIFRPDVYAEYRAVVRDGPLLVVEGQVQQRDGVTNLLARRAWPLG
jgi:error-prone DNA polymerase